MSTDTVIASLQEKIDDLNRQAWEARVNDSPKAFQLSQESVNLARSINYSKGLAEGLRSLGFGYVRLFKNDEAAPLLRESLSLFKSLNDIRGQAVVYEYLGIIERNWGNLGASLELLLKGYALIQQVGSLEIEVTCCYQIGVTYKHLGNHENALDYLYRSLSIAKKANNALMEAYSINIIGSIYFDNGDYNDALDCYQRGLVIRRESHDKWGEAGSLDNIGFTYLKLNDLDKATDYCKQSLKITQSTGDKKGEANTLLHLAEIFQQAGDVRQASTFSNESLEIRKARGDRRGEAEVLLFLADLYKNGGDTEDHQIFEWLSGALKIADEIKAQDLLSKAYYNLHEYHTQKGNHKESLLQLEAHLQIEKELHKNTINQKISNLEISHKAETISQRNKELVELNEKIEKANEELKIEASLERVRARTMAMQRSDELPQAANLLFQQIESLGIHVFSTGYNIWNEGKRSVTSWMSSQGIIQSPFKLPLTDEPSLLECYEAAIRGDKFFVQELSGQRLISHLNYMSDLPVIGELMKQMKEMGIPFPDHMINHHAFFSQGYLLFISYEPVPDAYEIFKRFAKVFEQTYTRFLDLQKAEAQAREAQIQLALERVRARTMAMQRSDELSEAASLLFQQVQSLGAPSWTAGYCIWDEDKKAITLWMSSPSGGIQPPFRAPLDENPTFIRYLEADNKGMELYIEEESGKVPEENYQYLLTLPVVGEILNAIMKEGTPLPTYQVDHCAYFSKGFLLFITYQQAPELHDIFKRFAAVFDQTYTRFLDLQKAEAQAREAQIETALEKVRSRSLAMHKSEEIEEVLHAVFERLKELGIDFYTAIIILFTEGSKDAEWWLESKAKHLFPRIRVPYKDIEYLADLFEAREKGIKSFSKCYSFEEKNKLFHHLFDHTDFKYVPEEQKKFLLETEFATRSVALAKNTGINITSYSRRSFSEEDNEVFKKFANVFDQAYTRFLDLQKAEAQAREAQIEVALERIRARAMAMHSSNELMDVANILREQMGLLDQPDLETSVVNLFEEDSELIFSWNASRVPGSSEKIISSTTSFPKNSSELTREMMSLYHSGEKEYTLEAAGLKLMEFLKVLIKANPQVADYIGKNPPEKVFYHFTTFTGGNLLTVSYQPPSEETKSLQRRAASVFDMAYRRYLDLKKAEAQAREAKIEVALEKVRSRTMAMHKSEELGEAAVLLYMELKALGVTQFLNCGYVEIDEENKIQHGWMTRTDGTQLEGYTIPLVGDDVLQLRYDAWKRKDPIFYQEIGGVKLKNHTEFTSPHLGSKEVDEMVRKQFPDPTIYYCGNFSHGYLHIITGTLLNAEEESLLTRFTRVFEMTYKRFLDLKQAEAQAREAQIEAALERVRAKVMAMSNSKDLNETSLVFGEQLRKLGIDWQFSYFWLVDEAKNENVFWITWPDYKTSFTSYTLAEAEEYFNDCLVSWRAGLKIHDNYVPPEGVKEWIDTFQRIADDAGGEAKKIMLPETFANGVYYYDAIMKYGSFGICISKPATDEEKKIQCRFAIEFERAYTRFLDLKQAEAQAREARIEVALERVRAKAMAMHKSDDLKTAVATVFEELDKLNIGILRCGIAIMDKEKPRADVWITVKSEQTNTIQVSGDESLDYHPLLRGAYDGWVKQEDFSYVLKGEDLLSYYRDVASIKYQLPVSTPFDKEKIDQQQYYFNAVFQDGSLFAFMETAFTDEAKTVMKRFANVFNLTYKRFLDLQKAEAQAREAQIELGLERVRARAMAMQKSVELKELIATVSTELSKLDIVLDRCVIMTYDIKTLGMTWWMANPETSSDPVGLYVKYHEHAPYLAFLKAWQDRVVKWQYVLEGSVKKTWDEFLFVETDLSQLPSFVIDNMRANDKVYLSASFNNFGCLTLATLEPLSDEQFDIMLRFAKVFDLTYTRFNDLKQAEAQAREARIEAALEKVRASTMAMQRSEDLSQTAFVLFNQFKELGEAPERIFIATFDDHDSGVIDLWGTDQGGNQLNKLFKLPVNEPTMVSKIIAAWKEKKRSVVVDLKGEDLKTYLGFLKQAGIPVTEGVMSERRVQTAACFSNGVIGVTTSEPQSAEAVQLQERFAGVFDLTYTRFLDLQKAEEQAHKAQIETALERVRARALAMQEPEELKDVAHVLRTEMGLLGVEELETCSIYINDESAEKAECWYALKDIRSEGKKLVNDHFALNLGETWVGREMLRFYQSPQKKISIVMQGENRKEWIRYCEQHSAPFRGYYGEVIPDRTYHLYKFSHGAIGAAAAGDISEESWRMLSRAASVFSLAYSRFKDLTQARTDLIKLKEEKKRAEEALTELQATQKQLIQSEKMASLGELTAGIAHEIQNPLNFVNNFSDVSNELLEEMKQELATGNTQQAIEIVNGVKENLEKILHHGKRADAIVKGMLQHSRSSSGQKELTDINMLAEEYLRLAYHGLRAKDKFFNPKFETDLDPSLNKINVVPQEIGRVILNLINNAFYAVTEKKKSLPPSPKGVQEKTSNDYEPIVTVTTKRLGPPLGDRGSVEIRVADNGNGIPQNLLDKIFQPFFTTKPTGQGTGLGLSLSYDIITKGHGGEIKVKTREGQGSEFIVSLPVN